MANPISERINAPPISELKPLSRQAVAQLPAMIQGGELSKKSQLPSELELARAPNIHRNTICKILFYLENERAVFRGCGGNLFETHRLNLYDNFNCNWWEEQTIEFHDIHTYLIEWFLPIQILQSIHQYFEQEIKLAKGPVKFWLRKLTADINVA